LEKKRMSAGKQAQRARLRTLAITAGFLAVVGIGYAIFPRHPDLRAIDPAAMARSETLMWRHYYDAISRWLLIFMLIRGPNAVSLLGKESKSRLRQPARPLPFSPQPRELAHKWRCRFLRTILVSPSDAGGA
jgi:hypothetical protein